MIDWLDGKANDDAVLQKTLALKNYKKGRHLLIITGSWLVQYYDYLSIVNRSAFDTMSMNFGYLLPGAENFTYHFHGSMGYIKTFQDCSTFKYFCQSFKGSHIFMTTTRHCAGALYPVAAKDDVIKTIKNNNISKYWIITHNNASKGFGYIPNSLDEYTPAHIPYGCGGSLGAMALPMALQMGYSKIFILGLGDQILTHFYDVPYVQPHLRKPITLPLRETILQRYRKIRVLAEKNGTQIFVIPKRYTEQSIQSVFKCLDGI